MVELKDGHVYMVVHMTNHLLLSYGIDQDMPGCWLTAQPPGDGRPQSRFRAIACPENKWKFAVVGKPNLCVGFQGSVTSGLQILADGGNECQTKWMINRGSSPKLVQIHVNADNGKVYWTIPDMGQPGTVIGLAGFEGSPEQRWKFATLVDQ